VKLGCPTEDEIDRISEAKASRDVLVHNRGIASKMYISKSGKLARFSEGQRIDVPEHYHRATWELIRKLVTDISNASRPITSKEMVDCKAAGVDYIEMPVAYDALTVVINPKNTFLKQATVEEMKTLWEPAAQGKIMKWNQVNPAWPDAPVKLFGAGADSGTFEYFTEAMVGKAKSSRGDYTASEDDNVLVQGVSRDVNAIGYFGYAYYAENMSRLKGLPIVNPKTGKAVEPSGANVENGTYAPLSRPIFVYVKAKSLEKPEVREFVEFYMKNAEKLVREVKYVPLPKSIYEGNIKHAKEKKVGTVFGGHNEIGITVEEIMKREAKM
jgi:phosphate transport system substrate-binding protein